MGHTIARRNAAKVALANQEPAFFDMHRYAGPPWPLNEMDMAAKLPIPDPVTEADDRLEQPRFRCERVVVVASPFQGLGFPGRRHVKAIGCAQHAQIGQHAEYAMAGQL